MTRKLLYAARTRNGFTPASRAELFKKVKPLGIEDCPFAKNLPEKKASRWGAGLTAAKMAVSVAEAGAGRAVRVR